LCRYATAKPSTAGQFGANGCIELDLMLRGLTAMEPEAGLPAEGDVDAALAAASALQCGWSTRWGGAR
jgi:hypothetical protein